ncbi:MAG TPA: hypothetical protein VGB17_06945 [Pyrinomonadaceae bacterium]|jgi:hypothetical protein
MELSTLAHAPEFLDNLVTEKFEAAGESVDITVNIDAFTSVFWRRISAQIRDRYLGGVKPDGQKSAKSRRGKRGAPAKPEPDEAFKGLHSPFELMALEDDQERTIYVDLLLTPGIPGQSPVLVDWGVKLDGLPIKPSREVLMGMPTPAVRALWLFCRRLADTVKKLPTRKTSPSKTTEETTEDGSSTRD